jgi:hypothetical protein
MPSTAPIYRPLTPAEAIRIDCERAIRRLNVLISERDDVLLHQVRGFVKHAAALADAQARS